MASIGDIFGAGGVANLGSQLLAFTSRFFPDKAEAAKEATALQANILSIAADQAKVETERGADVIEAEAKGESALQRNWRPLLMFTFMAIIINNYILYPYLKAFWQGAMVLELPPEMWSILKIGIGGYVGGRSAEKIMDSWKGGGK
jgi:predicted MFS family arabinose efflux permease